MDEVLSTGDVGQQLSPPGDDNAYQVVARRYRPQGFGELIGQEHVAQALSNAITTNRIGHAYLFTGARGVGKTSTARIFAKALNCEHGPTVTPCNVCDACIGISSGQDVDVIEIDGASNRSIDDVKAIRQNVSFRPSRSRFKIYIIDEVHMLTEQAFNALLKTLEEPPEHVKFIFCTTEPGKIPITILSRCQRFDFAGIDSEAISVRLEQIARKEGAEPEPGVCEILARRANGSMRDAQSLLEQLLAFAPHDIRLDDVHAMLGTVDDQKLFDILSAVDQSEPAALFPVLDRAVADGTDLVVLVEQLIGVFRDMMVLSSGCPRTSLVYTPDARYEELKSLADSLGIERILASLQILDQTLQRMRYSTQGRILVEMALVRLVCLERLGFVSRLIDQLRSGRLPDLQLGSGSPASNRPSPNRPSSNRPASSETVSNETASGETMSAPSSNTPQAVVAPTVPPVTDTELPTAPVPVPVPERKREPEPVRSSVPPGEDSRPGPSQPPISPRNKGNWIPFDTLTDQMALALWQQTVQGIKTKAALAASARTVTRIHFERPNRFSLFFDPGKETARKYCQSNQKTLLDAFAVRFPEPIHVEFVLEKGEAPEQPNSDPRPTGPSKTQLLYEIQDHPVVRRVCDLFGAELHDVQ